MRYVFLASLWASLAIFGDVWMQTDWEGGAGQTVYSDSTMFQTGDAEYLFHPGQLWLHSPDDTVWYRKGSSGSVRFEPGSNLTTDIIYVDDTVFAATAFNGYVYYSSNYVVWNSMDTLPTVYAYGNVISVITKGEDNSIYIGGVEKYISSAVSAFVWRSDDHKSWVNPDSLDTTHTLPQGDPDNIKNITAVISVDDTTLLAGTDGGNGSSADYKGLVFRSFNRGVTWDTVGVYGIYITKFIRGAGDTIWMLTGDVGWVNSSGSMMYTTDIGSTWTTKGSIPDTLFSSAAKKDTMWIGGTGMNSGIYLSYDNGVTWAESPGDTVIPDTAFVTNILVAYDGSMYATTYNDGKIYKSTDDGITWDSLYDLTAESGNRSITEMVQTKEGHLLAAAGDNLGSGLDSACVLFSGYTPEGYIVSSIFHSPYDYTSYGVLHYKKGGPGFVYVKVRTGSDNWMHDAMNWDSCDIAKDGDSLLNLNSVDKKNYIQYRVEMKSVSSILSPYFDSISVENFDGIDEGVKKKNIQQGFKVLNNLVSDKVYLSFAIPEDRDADISVYNVMGDKVKTLFHSHLGKGNYRDAYSMKGVPSGIYFVSFKAGEDIQNRKIVVIK